MSFESTPPPHEESDLIFDAQEGDRTAFARLIERYWDRLFRFLYHLTRDVHMAEDLTQETFMKAFAALHSFQLGSNFRAWLFRIAHNNFINQRRKRQHALQPLPSEFAETSIEPLEALLGQEMLTLIADAVSKLPSEFRAALLLRVDQGLSFREIARILGTTEQTARWRVFKARQRLLQVLANDEDSEAETGTPPDVPPTVKPQSRPPRSPRDLGNPEKRID